jgi:hypothetical protein
MINIISNKASINDVKMLLDSLGKHMEIRDSNRSCIYKRYDKASGKYKPMDRKAWRDEIKTYRERAHKQVLFAIHFLADLTMEGETDTDLLDNLKNRCYKYLNFLVDLSISPDTDKKII